jgi:hypothetical protein
MSCRTSSSQHCVNARIGKAMVSRSSRKGSYHFGRATCDVLGIGICHREANRICRETNEHETTIPVSKLLSSKHQFLSLPISAPTRWGSDNGPPDKGPVWRGEDVTNGKWTPFGLG